MKNIAHPSAYINAADVATIRDAAPGAELMAMLHPDQLAVIYREGWFRLLVPKIYGGRQITLPQLVRLQEAISWADGSTGWVVTLCSGAGWFGGFLPEQTGYDVFKDPKVCLAGSGATTGTAEITPNGYRLSGTWKYASGIHHATHITANCLIKKKGEQVVDENGNALVLPFLVDKKDVELLSAWKYVGMIATGSDAFKMTDLEVPRERQFKIDAAAAVVYAPLYQYPFLQLAEATLAVNISGIAIHFMDLCDDVFKERINHPRLTGRQKEFLFEELAAIRSALNNLRIPFFEAVERSWNAMQTGNLNEARQLEAVSNTSRQLAKFAREGVDRLYPLCGLIAAGSDTEINRAWRDLHTASQHALLTFTF